MRQQQFDGGLSVRGGRPFFSLGVATHAILALAALEKLDGPLIVIYQVREILASLDGLSGSDLSKGPDAHHRAVSCQDSIRSGQQLRAGKRASQDRPRSPQVIVVQPCALNSLHSSRPIPAGIPPQQPGAQQLDLGQVHFGGGDPTEVKHRLDLEVLGFEVVAGTFEVFAAPGQTESARQANVAR